MKHTLVALVEDKPGVLNRVASLFRRRAFNIESLTVGHTDQPHISRMTIVIDSDNSNAHLVEANLAKLVNVIDVQDVTGMDAISRDLALIKVRADASGRAEIAQLTEIFRAKIVDVAPDSVIVEVTGDEDKIDGLVELLRPKGILEMVRTGRISMLRGNQSSERKSMNIKVNGNGNGHVQHSGTSGASSV
ncbi:MAG TPA: acetolactate synthase small subunit [Anaerolineae bacterium]|nr:acetolactate synthase small subunit [Anaerolineae bacterium]